MARAFFIFKYILPENSFFFLKNKEGVPKITERKEKALAALLTSQTQEEAANKLGITARTIRQYLQDPEFSQKYKEASSNLITDATEQIQKSLSPAIATLRNIAEDENAVLNARVSAARGLLEYGIRLAELSELYKRIEELEERL